MLIIFILDFPFKISLPSLTKIDVSANFIIKLSFHSILVSFISIRPSLILDFIKRSVKFLLFLILFETTSILRSIFLLLKISVFSNSAKIALVPNKLEIFISSVKPSRIE